MIAVERGFLLEDADGALHPLPELWTDPTIRMNEGGCDPDGRFWCGSMSYDQVPGAGSVHRLDPDGTVRVAFGDVTISNGLEWSPDGSLAYYNDTPTHEISVFDYDASAGLTGRRSVRGPGRPQARRPHGRRRGRRLDGVVRRRRRPPLHPGRHSRRRRGGPDAEGHRLHVRRSRPRRAVHHHLVGGPRPGRRAGGRIAVPGRFPASAAGRCARSPAEDEVAQTGAASRVRVQTSATSAAYSSGERPWPVISR